MSKAIITEHVYPPIPAGKFDWAAYRDGYEPGAIYGEGPTERAAILDLMEKEGDEQPLTDMEKDALRWRALVRANPAQETDISSGPGSPKLVLLRIDVTGCERYMESGAPDYKATLNAAMDAEISANP